MKKLVFISNMAAPYQVKKCYELNKYLDTEFWFYTYLEKNRPRWWKIPLGDKCKILNNVIAIKEKYFTFDVIKKLNKFNPDIVMLGGFSIPGNYLAYRWAKTNNKKTVVFTELSRNKKGVLRSKDSLFWKVLKKLYKDVDLIMTANKEAKEQFEQIFNKKTVIESQYGADIDEHLTHPLRKLENKKKIVLLFANRLIDIYNPLLAIDIFYKLQKEYPNIILKMNNDGYLKKQCISKIEKYGIKDKVFFLDSIKSWNDLHLVYKNSDILFLPAIFSNGNMSIIEAMASGMGIVISNKVNGHSDVLTHNENCFICNVDKKEFVEAIKKYLDEKNLIKLHGKINKEKVKYLSLSNTAKSYYDELKKEGLLN